MSEENNLINPQKIDIKSFPKPKKRKKKRSNFFHRMRKKYNRWKNEKRIERSKAKRKRHTLSYKISKFFKKTISNIKDDIKLRKALKQARRKQKQAPFFKRLYLLYRENQDQTKETKQLNLKLKKSLSFILEEDKRVFSWSDEISHIKDTWRSLPWKLSRELENMIVITLVIVFSFSFNYILLQTTKYFTASLFDIPAIWENGHIVFPISDYSDLWTYSSVISVYISGPIVNMLSGFIFLFLYRRNEKKNTFISLLLLWLYLTAFILFFGTFFAGTITNRGFGYVMGWLFIPYFIEILFGVVSVFSLWMIGHFATKRFLAFAPGRSFSTNLLPQFFIKTLYIYIPVFFAIAMLLLIGFNSRDFTIKIVYLSILILLTPTLRFYTEKII